jgi:4-hydroxy-2-oxoheptanedioate aldolase
MKNKLKEIWALGGVVMNGWLHIPSTWTAELMAHVGWDCVTVDMQHGLHSMETAIQMMQAIATSDAVCLARSNWNDEGQIMRLLDGGAFGIICPMVNTKAECEKFVGACRYPPAGYRSFGPTRARLAYGNDYGEFANDEVITMAMVESAEALNNIADIASVRGLDGIFVGSGDLRLSLTGTNKKTEDGGVFDAAIETILSHCNQNNIIAGIWCPSVEEAVVSINKGFRFIAIQSDSMILSNRATEISEQLRSAISKGVN